MPRFPAVYGSQVEIDFCFGCQGLWFDQLENLKLASEAIATVFREMHRHHDAPRQPLAEWLGCPQRHSALVQGLDLMRSGRFSSFASFMIEKGFVQQLTQSEITDVAAKVGVIHCSNCGAPLDLRREDACSHCRSALSLLDPQAVEKALAAHARERAREGRQPVRPSGAHLLGAGMAVDLLGLRLVGSLLDD